jgi:hypothetical protein
MRNANAIPETSDPMDDMLLTDRDTVIVTQAGSANDTFPAPYGQDDTALAGGLGDVRSAKRLAPLGVVPESGQMKEQALMVQRDHASRYVHNRVLSRGRNKQRRLGVPTRGGGRFVPGMGDVDENDFMPGMGDLGFSMANLWKNAAPAKPGRWWAPAAKSRYAKIIVRPTDQALFGEHDAETDDVSGLGAAPARLKPKMVVHKGVATKAMPAMKARTPRPVINAPFPMGDDAGLGIGFGTLALIGLGAYFLLRKRK